MKFKAIIFGVLLCFFVISCDSSNPFSSSFNFDDPFQKIVIGNRITVTLNFKGKVTNKNDGSPIQGAQIRLFSELDTNHMTVRTDKNGDYSMHYHGEVSDFACGLRAEKRHCSWDGIIIENFTDEEQVFNFEIVQFDK